MLKIIDIVLDFISRYIAAIGISAGVAIAFYNVAARYLFNHSLPWAADLTTYLFIWSTFFGAAYCFKKDAHISINILLDKVSSSVAKILIIISLSITFIYLSAIAYFGYEYILLLNDMGERSVDLEISMWIIYLVIPIAFVFCAFFVLNRIIDAIRTKAENLSKNDEVKELLAEAERKTGGML